MKSSLAGDIFTAAFAVLAVGRTAVAAWRGLTKKERQRAEHLRDRAARIERHRIIREEIK